MIDARFHQGMTGGGQSVRNRRRRLILAAVFLLLGQVGPVHAQYASGSRGIHGVFPAAPGTANYALVNMTTGLVRFCSGYDEVKRPDTCTTELSQAQIPGILPGELTTGIFEFTDVVFGNGGSSYLKYYFVGNKYNHPVIILSQGDIVIQLRVDIVLRGGNGENARSALGVALIGGKGGLAGPGGYPGGAGGDGGVVAEHGAPGIGPGGGAGGATSGAFSAGFTGGNASSTQPNTRLIPLVGGSGGGGAAGVAPGTTGCGTPTIGFGGGGGAGGGGSILLAADQSVVISVPLSNEIAINVSGGVRGTNNVGGGCNLLGGYGNAGSIRIVARDIRGGGYLQLCKESQSSGSSCPGTSGKLVMESYTNSYTGTVMGAVSINYLNAPSRPIPAAIPSLRITSVGGVAVGPNPTNNVTTPDVNFPAPPTNPVTVDLAGIGIPLGTSVSVRLASVNGDAVSSATTTLAGTEASSTASAQVTVPPGAGSITAFASFTLTTPLASAFGLEELPKIDGETPDRVEVAAGADGGSEIYLVTPSGRRMRIGRG